MVFKCSTFTTIDVRFDQSKKKNADKGCAKKTAMLNHKSATFVCASQNFVLVVMVVGWGYILIRPKKKTSSAQTNIACKLRNLERCGCAHSKADGKSFIFFF